MTRVLVLGSTGMLGSMVAAVLADHGEIEVVGAHRRCEPALDVRRDDPVGLLDAVAPAWVINAVGVLRSRIDAQSSASVAEAIEVNGCFPHRLALAAATRGARVIHAATDGVFSGRDGPYSEDAPHDAGDVYAQTKSLGEAPGEHVLNLRCSVVGPERGSPRSLLGRLLEKPRGAVISGFVDQRWNGITTLQYAQICASIVSGGERWHGGVHVVPADTVSKAELIRILARAYGRDDLEIEEVAAPVPSDHSLATLDQGRNLRLWQGAGHAAPPTIAAMITELAGAHR